MKYLIKSVIMLVLISTFVGNMIVTSAQEETVLKSGNYEYTILEDNTVEITRYIGKESEVVVPSNIDGMEVTSIGSFAFSYCDEITYVIVSNGVKRIADYAFNLCVKLKEICFSDSVTYIDFGAFSNCQLLSKVDLPKNLEVIESYAFGGCKSLESVTIPDHVVSIKRYAFESEKLTKVFIPKNVKEIASGAFACCTALESISVDNNNEFYTSKDGVLYNKSLDTLVQYPSGKENKEYRIPDGIKNVLCGSVYCKALKKIIIPKSIINIESSEEGTKYCLDWYYYWGMNNSTEIEGKTFSYITPVLAPTLSTDIYGYPYTYAEQYFGKRLNLLEKKNNTLTTKSNSCFIKAKKLKSKKQTVKPIAIKNAQGTIKVTKVKSGTTAKIYKKIKVNSKTGAITFKKGKYAKKTYKINLKIKVSGNSTYKSKTLYKTVKVRIK